MPKNVVLLTGMITLGSRQAVSVFHLNSSNEATMQAQVLYSLFKCGSLLSSPLPETAIVCVRWKSRQPAYSERATGSAVHNCQVQCSSMPSEQDCPGRGWTKGAAVS